MIDLSEKFEYSEAEKKLFADIGISHLLELSIHPPGIYDLALEKVFLDDQKGPHVEALRRGFRAFKACKPYRMTPEFDALITYTPEEKFPRMTEEELLHELQRFIT